MAASDRARQDMMVAVSGNPKVDFARTKIPL
jgi:hypothetical protein